MKTITDTCGRVFKFVYRELAMGDMALAKVIGPAPGQDWSSAQVDTDLVVLNIGGCPLKTSFEDPVHEQPAWSYTISGLYYPATHTGYWFPTASYTSYGMLKRVQACRGMSLTSVGSNATTGPLIVAGPVTWQRDYDYPDAGAILTDTPTYTTVTESWEGQTGGPAVTRFQIQSDADRSRTEILWPDGAKTITETTLPAADSPGGLLSELTVLDPGGRMLQQVNTYWQIKGDGTPQVTTVDKINALGGLAKTTFAYEPDATLPSFIDEWDYWDQPGWVVRRTHTTYLQDRAYLSRNLRNLPHTVRVTGPFDGRDPDGPKLAVTAALTAYGYDESDLADTPGVVGFEDRFNPASPSYDRSTAFRGLVTTVTRYADAAKQPDPIVDPQLGDPIVEERTYDRCGNLCTADRGAGRTEYLYRPEARYLAPSATRLTATDPADGTWLEVSATSYFSDGRPSLITDANGERTELQYDSAGRVTGVLTRGVAVDVVYDDVEFTQTRTVRDRNDPGTVAHVEVLRLDGYGRVLSKRTVLPGGWSTVDYQYDSRGRVGAVSVPHWLGDPVQWTTTEYDALHRPLRATDPVGDVTLWRYDEAVAPDNMSGATPTRPGPAPGPDDPAPGARDSRVRITSPSGAERYVQFDALGRVWAVVEPEAAGTGSVLPFGNSRTEYSYDPNGNVTKIDTLPYPSGEGQHRQFRYDSLSRLVRLFLPECGHGIVEEPGSDGLATWSIALAHDERSNLIFRKDSRGAITRHDYGGDPLDRLQSILYDRSEVTDTTSVVLPCADVHYSYVTDGDIRRVHQELADGVCGQTFTYDPFAGLISTTVTMTSAPNFPFTVDYPHDSLGRSTGVVYPQLYGESAARPIVGLEHQTGAPLWLTLDGQQLASGLSFSPTRAIKAMHVGPPGPAEVTETYDYDGKSPELQGQQLTRDGGRLLDVSYNEYWPPTFGPAHGLVRQLKTATDHLDKASSRAYTYDALGRLKTAAGGEQPSPTWTQTYTYDRWGNRAGVTATGEFAPGQPATADGRTDLAYDEDTNQLLPAENSPHPVRYDAAGNLLVDPDPTTGRERYYQYDTAGRLVRVTRTSLDDLDTEYVYGACNRRRATVRTRHHIPEPEPVPDPSPSGPASITDPNQPYDTIESTTFYAWDGDHVIAEYDNPGPAQGDALTWSTTRMFFGSRLLSHRENFGTGGHRTLYDHPGRTGTRYVTGPNLDENHESLPFGSSAFNDDEASSFTSYDRDALTGLDYAVNRFYHPALGRFLQTDPLGAASFDVTSSQSLNLYAYCRDDPINCEDPLGLRMRQYCIVLDDGTESCWWVWEDDLLPGRRTIGGGGGGGGGRAGGGSEHSGPTISKPDLSPDEVAERAKLLRDYLERVAKEGFITFNLYLIELSAKEQADSDPVRWLSNFDLGEVKQPEPVVEVGRTK